MNSGLGAVDVTNLYFPLGNRPPGPEIVDLGGLSGPLLPQNPLEKVGGFAPPPFPMGFAVGGRLETKVGDFQPGGSIA